MAIVLGCVYLLLGAERFYKVDGIDIVRLLDDRLQGAPESLWPHPWHVGFLPALEAFRRLAFGLGLSPTFLQLGAWFSAVGAALGIAFAHAGFRRLAERRVAWLATILLAGSPVVLLFATVVEFHGPLLAPLGMCIWWLSRQVQRPSWWGMALLGGLCHGAFLIHGQALFFPAWLLVFFVVSRGERIGLRDLLLAATAGAVHSLLWLLMPRLLPEQYGFWADLSSGVATQQSASRPQFFANLPAIVWQEWLQPLLPLSWLVFAAPFVRSLRREFVAFAIGALPFLYWSVRLLVNEPEHGAYMLPVVPAAALLVARLLRGRVVLGLVVLLAPLLFAALGGRVSLLPQIENQPQEETRQMRAMIDAVAEGAVPFVLVGSHAELGSVYECLPLPARRRDRMTEDRFLWLRALAAMPVHKVTPAHFAGVEAFLRALHAQGRAVLMTHEGLRSLLSPRATMLAENPASAVGADESMAGPLFAQHLRDHFVLQDAGGLYRLVPK